jgi:hypothetical protein
MVSQNTRLDKQTPVRAPYIFPTGTLYLTTTTNKLFRFGCGLAWEQLLLFPLFPVILAHMHAPHARRRQSGCCGCCAGRVWVFSRYILLCLSLGPPSTWARQVQVVRNFSAPRDSFSAAAEPTIKHLSCICGWILPTDPTIDTCTQSDFRYRWLGLSAALNVPIWLRRTSSLNCGLRHR